MELEVGAFGGMTARAGHHLAGSWIEDIFADGMGENAMFSMTFATDIIDGSLGHGRMVRAMRSMAVVAGIRVLMGEF